MVKVGEEYLIRIEHINNQGQGIGRINGFVVFVNYGLLNELVRVRITIAKKDYAVGKIIEFIEENKNRTNPACRFYYSCGGCHLMHANYSYQLELKKIMVEDAIRRIGKLNASILDVIGMENPYRYRNKAQLPVGKKNGRVLVGLYKPGTHEIVDIDKCLIQHEETDKVIHTVRELVKKFNISVYNEIIHNGLLRHVVVRKSFTFPEMMIILVFREFPNKIRILDLVKFLRSRLKGMTSLYFNINPEKTNVIMGEESILIWGDPYIKDKIGPFIFHISPESFFQVNSIQTGILYNKVLDFIEERKRVIFDAYCGVGTISLFLSQKAEKVYGIEVIPEAVENARKNAERNKVKNVEFICGKSEEVIPELIEKGIIPDVIVVDPPRKGCDEKLLNTIIENKIKEIVYVSCHPSTLARDAKILTDAGYKLVSVQPVDMFPQTFHVESVAKFIFH
ncbi:MAG: 23S rRNA (uracil(1939)-C(5))-methyltransferase RlmD [Dictyoglomus sp. NZ13-RE01]|nr:MAG: 23S rRNA (uracil(1939)-C(5))-methyltransferase RlmD [Dictyoglomus sp. NZ13-RE01]